MRQYEYAFDRQINYLYYGNSKLPAVMKTYDSQFGLVNTDSLFYNISGQLIKRVNVELHRQYYFAEHFSYDANGM